MNTNTKKNIALALCLSSMLIAPPSVDAAVQENPINIKNPGDVTTITDDLNITGVGDSQDDKSTMAAVSLVKNTSGYAVTLLELTGDTVINVGADKYALYSNSMGYSGMISTISVNPNGDKKVQIVGDIKTEVGHINIAYATIDLNMKGADSYFVGDIEMVTIDNQMSNVNLKLADGATWYPRKDTYALGALEKRQIFGNDGLHIDATGGGVIDIYHSAPDTMRSTVGTRTFTLDNINEKNSSASGATFRIGSNIGENAATKSADKIVLNGNTTGIAVPASSEYYIQVAGDTSITATQNTTYNLASKNIVVAQVDGTQLTNANTTITGSAEIYKDAAINGGLGLADIKTNIAQGSDPSQWILDSLALTNVRNGDGAGMQMAKLGTVGAQATAAAWRADSNDLMRRMGDLRSGSGESGAWGKIYGGQLEVRKGVDSKLDYQAVQVGYDRAHTVKSGKLFTGVTLSHLRGDTSSVVGTGDLNSTMFGIYGSYIGERGHFADLIIKYGHLSNKVNSNDAGNSYEGEFSSNGINISAEYGYRHNFKNNVYIEPQVELTYSNLGGSDYTMRLNGGNGASVHTDAYKSLIGRIGFTLGKQYKQNNVYLKLGLAHEFQGDMSLNAIYNGVNVPYKVSGKSTWMEYGIGFNVATGKNANIYGELEKTTGTVVRTNWRAHMGVRVGF